MSQQNLEILVRLVEAFNQDGMEAVPMDLLDDEVVFSEPPEQPGATTFHGREACLEGLRQWSSSREAQHSEIERVVDAGDAVVVLTNVKLLGRDGVEVTQRNGAVYTFKDGRIVRVEAYWDQDKALAAAGVSE